MNKKQHKTRQRELLELIGAFVVAWTFYQILSVILGTSLPVVSVVSDSMYHTSHFGTWWTENADLYSQYGISRNEFTDFLAPSGLSRGDLLVVTRADTPQVGDVLIYRRQGSSFTIVHRLVDVENDYYIVKGDNNNVTDPPVPKQYVIGKVVFAVPVLGYPRLILHMFGI